LNLFSVEGSSFELVGISISGVGHFPVTPNGLFGRDIGVQVGRNKSDLALARLGITPDKLDFLFVLVDVLRMRQSVIVAKCSVPSSIGAAVQKIILNRLMRTNTYNWVHSTCESAFR